MASFIYVVLFIGSIGMLMVYGINRMRVRTRPIDYESSSEDSWNGTSSDEENVMGSRWDDFAAQRSLRAASASIRR